MGRPKRWYNPEAAVSVRVIGRDDPNESFCSIRWRHPRVDPTLWECLRYPLTDGPGLGLLFFFPPILWLLSLPIFDIIAVLQPMTRRDWRLGLMVVPVMIPVIFSFSMIFGYAIVFLGHVLVASSLGENDHPSWPEWHPADIAEGILPLDLGNGRRPARWGPVRSFCTGTTAAKSTYSTAWCFPC